MEKWRFEHIWLHFSIWTFLILPWVAIYILAPQVMDIYDAVPTNLIFITLIAGVLFGIGQICFAFSLSIIGIGLSFVINLGLGTGFGFLLPLVFQHPEKILTPFGLVTMFGTLLAILGLIVSTYAGKLRDQEHKAIPTKIKATHAGVFLIGVLMSTIAGFTSAGQNFAFSLTGPMQQIAAIHGASALGASIVMWPLFLTCAFVPYVLYMFYLHFKNHSFGHYCQSGTAKYYLYEIIMAAFWFGSLIFYSKATQLIGKLGPVVVWPMFMVLIVLASNFWGWRLNEWAGCSKRVKHVLWCGLLLLIAAMLVLGYSSWMHA